MNRYYRLFFIAAYLTGTLFSGIAAENLTVTITNGTTGKPQNNVSQVSLIDMVGGMKTLASKKSGPYRFSDIAASQGMVMAQAVYHGVKYNKMVRLDGADKSISIEVFELKTGQTKGIDPVMTYQFDYYHNILLINVIIEFRNDTKYAFSEDYPERGFFLSVPPGGSQPEAIASLGDTHGNVQWVKVDMIPVEGSDGLFLINQAIKPGNRFYNIQYMIHYDGSELALPLVNHYEMIEIPTAYVSEELQLKFKNKSLKKDFDRELDRSFYYLSNRKGAYELIVSGGVAMDIPGQEGQGQEQEQGSQMDVSTSALMENWQKAIPVIVMLLLGFGIVEYVRKKPAWLQMSRAKSITKIQFEIDALKSIEMDEEKKARRVQALQAKLDKLNLSVKG